MCLCVLVTARVFWYALVCVSVWVYLPLSVPYCVIRCVDVFSVSVC